LVLVLIKKRLEIWLKMPSSKKINSRGIERESSSSICFISMSINYINQLIHDWCVSTKINKKRVCVKIWNEMKRILWDFCKNIWYKNQRESNSANNDTDRAQKIFQHKQHEIIYRSQNTQDERFYYSLFFSINNN